METAKTITYSGIFFSCFANDGTKFTQMVKDHTINYVYAGELVLDNNGQKITVHKGQCVFLKRDHRLSTLKRALDEEQYRGITLTFSRHFLREFYNKMNKDMIPAHAKRIDRNIVRIEPRADITSLFESLTPYFDSDIEPSQEIINFKEQEGVLALLRTDPGFYPTLFDFTEPWKIDIPGFMEQNYMYDLSLEEIATFTGRSLASFKRDFTKVNALTPQKWIIRRRLQAAYDMMQNEGKKVSEVYTEVGFKNLSHFYAAFKRQYGYSPKK